MSRSADTPPLRWQALEPERRDALLALWERLSDDTREMLHVWIAQGWEPTPADVADLLRLDLGEETPDEQIARIRRALRARLD